MVCGAQKLNIKVFTSDKEVQVSPLTVPLKDCDSEVYRQFQF